jgi:hypothetical protein
VIIKYILDKLIIKNVLANPLLSLKMEASIKEKCNKINDKVKAHMSMQI